MAFSANGSYNNRRNGNISDATMATRNVVLTERQETLIETLVRSGRYQNASEVLRDGLRLLEQREADEAARLDALRQASREGFAALDAGEARTFATVADLERHLATLTEKVVGRRGR